MNITYSLERISKIGNLDAILILLQYNSDLMFNLMEINLIMQNIHKNI